MRRKVSRIGPATLMVSLPAPWVKAYGIKKGDEVEVTIEGACLRIENQKEKGESRATADVSGLGPMIKRILGALYKAGFHEMEIRFSTASELGTIQEVIREEFIGFEIVEHHKTTIIAKEVTKAVPEEFGNIANRILNILCQMAKDLEDALERHDTQHLRAIALRDKDINKLADYCRRILNQRDLQKVRNPPLYVIVEQLEKVGDVYRDLCALNQPPEKPLFGLFLETNRLLERFISCYRNFSLVKITEFANHYHYLTEKSRLVRPTSKNTAFYVKTCHLAELVFDMNGPLMASLL